MLGLGFKLYRKTKEYLTQVREWILSDGTWDDTKYWDDSETWND